LLYESYEGTLTINPLYPTENLYLLCYHTTYPPIELDLVGSPRLHSIDLLYLYHFMNECLGRTDYKLFSYQDRRINQPYLRTYC